MKSKLKLDKMISMLPEGKSADNLDMLVTEKIYKDVRHLLIDGKYKGFRLIC